MTALIKYEQACRALADAKAVDEVKDVRDKAEAMRIYARQAKNRDLEIDAAEIRMRAERRLGEMITSQKETVGLNRGSAGIGKPASAVPEEYSTRPPTLADAGIDRKLSSHAQKMAAVPEAQFESMLGAWREEAKELNARVTTNLLKVGEEERRRQARRDLAAALSNKAAEITGQRRYACLYVDPPWKRKQGLTDRSYENHYPTMTWDEIVAWAQQMRGALLDDSWMFMWVPRAHAFALHPVTYQIDIGGEIVEAVIPVPLAWAIARALGMDAYCTGFDWTKTDDDHPDDCGMGILVRDQDEWLLMFKRGRGLPKPEQAAIVGSNHRERSRPLGHSRKPQYYRQMIAGMVGAGVPVLECFARADAQFPLPPGWDAWGNQAGDEQQSREPAESSDPDQAKSGGRLESPSMLPEPASCDAACAEDAGSSDLDIPPFLNRRTAGAADAKASA